jgi:peptidoglycan hydrolase-like protein with peptidoglycan-binding domain
LTERASHESFDPPVAVDGVVKANAGALSRDVTLVLTWRAPGALMAPDWAGVVQAVPVAAGQAVASGDVVARIAGVDRIACASDYPMAGPVALKDKGQDVETLQRCLSLAGFDAAQDKGVYGQATKAAVAAWSKQTGAASDNGNAFDAAWLVFLPEENYELLTVDLEVAAQAPVGGTAIATARPSLTRAVLSSLEDSRGSEMTGGEAEPVPTDQEVAPEELITANPDESLLVGSMTIKLAQNRGEVAAEGLAELSGQVPPNTTSVNVKLQREGAADELLVPAAAVVAVPQGGTCVLRVEGSGIKAVVVEVVGDTSGSAIVKGNLSPGDRVRLSPVAEDRQCGST